MLPFVCIDWLSLSLIKSKKVWIIRAPKYQAEQAHSLKFNNFIVLLTIWVTFSSEVSRLKRKGPVFCSVEYRFKIRMSLWVTEIMITFLAGDVCKRIWPVVHLRCGLSLMTSRDSVYHHLLQTDQIRPESEEILFIFTSLNQIYINDTKDLYHQLSKQQVRRWTSLSVVVECHTCAHAFTQTGALMVLDEGT